MMKRILILISAVIFCLKISAQDDRGYIVRTGQKAPDFTVTMTDGKKFRLSDQKGKVVMIQFTASWCSVCRREMPFIESDIWLPYKDNKSFTLIGIDRDEPLNTVKKFAETTKITYPLALDPGADVFALYAARDAGITRNVIVDQNGQIVFLTRLFNEDEFNAMKDVIKKLLR